LSITSARNFIEKSGCGLILGIVLVLVLFAGVFYSCGGNGGGSQNPADVSQQSAIAVIGDFQITPAMLQAALDRQGSLAQDRSPQSEAGLYSQTLYTLVNQGVLLELAKKYGVTLTNEQLVQAELAAFDGQLQAVKSQLISQGKLKANSTQAEFEAELQKLSGKSLAETKDQLRKEVEAAVADPQKRSEILINQLANPIRAKIETTLKPTEDDIKSQFRTYTVKRIYFGNAAQNPNAKQEAEAAAQAMKSGTSFEALMEKYSRDVAQPGKKKGEATMDYPASMVTAFPMFQPIAALKPGEASAVIEDQNGRTMYKLVKINDNVPKDFDKNKETHRKSYLASKASQLMAEESLKIAQSDALKWNSAGFRLLYESFLRLADPNAPSETAEQRKQRLEKVIADGAKAKDQDAIGAKAAVLARYAAMDELWREATEAEKQVLRNQRMQIIEDALVGTESIDLRLELADQYIDAKNAQKALEQVAAAARANSDYTALGQANFGKIQARIQKLADFKLISSDEQKQIQAEQTRWVEDKAAFEKEQAALKKQQQEDLKRMEQEKKAGTVKPTGRSAKPATPENSPGR